MFKKLSGLLLLLSAASVYAADPATPSEPAAPAESAAPAVPATQVNATGQPDIQLLQTALGNRKPDSVTPTAIPGLYEVLLGTQIFYLSADGRFALQGDLLDLKNRDNLTENRRDGLRLKAINAVEESNMVVFAPSGPVKHTVTIFTDIDCGYCRKLHKEMAEYNKQGIKVRYLMYPRAGAGSESFNKAVAVWCADNRQEAMTRAKNGEPVENKSCANPIKEQLELGQRLGVRGTPSMILDNGEMVPGYVPPAQLAQMLDGNSN